MLIEQIIEFESRVPGPLVVPIFLKLVIFMTKQKAVSRALARIPMQKAAATVRFPTLKSCCAGPVFDIKKLLHRSGFVCDLNTALCNIAIEATMA